MVYDSSSADARFPGRVGAPLPGFAGANATVRDAAGLRLKIEDWRRYVRRKAIPHAFRRIIAEALTGLVRRNPVGNPSFWKRPPRKGYVGGHSRRNWQISLSPLAAELPGEDAREDAANVAVAQGYAAIASLPETTRRAWLVNATPYMGRLNRGWSRQAPAGWIDSELARVISKFNRVK